MHDQTVDGTGELDSPLHSTEANLGESYGINILGRKFGFFESFLY